MNLLEIHAQLVCERTSALKHGTEAGLVKIFGADWELIRTAGQRKEFGGFKAAIQCGIYPDIEWIRIENAGRYDVPRK